MSELKEARSLLHLIEQSRIPLSLISCEEGAFFFFFSFIPEEHLDIDPVTIPKPRPLEKKPNSKPANRPLVLSPPPRDNTSDLTIHES